jgi:phosphonate degradation associated HDIG domain protein
MNTIEKTVEDIFELYEKHGSSDYIGEPVSQIEHMSQAAYLAIREGADDEVVLAAFFHDIGHICVADSNAGNSMDGYGVKSHEKIGADFLRERGFPERVVRLTESHVHAKRYLTFKYPYYYQALSEASKRTLEFQGGKMTAAEADAFEKDPLFELIILMRKWDEMAKEINVPLIDINDLKRRAVGVLSQVKELT